MRRLVPRAAGWAVAWAVLVFVVLGCGSQTITPPHPAVRTSQAGQSAPVRTPSALDSCVADVDQLLVEDRNAIENGYTGIDTNQVMTQYGISSPVFEAYIQLQGQLTYQVDEYGSANALAPVERQTVATCQQYGA